MNTASDPLFSKTVEFHATLRGLKFEPEHINHLYQIAAFNTSNKKQIIDRLQEILNMANCGLKPKEIAGEMKGRVNYHVKRLNSGEKDIEDSGYF